MGSVCNWGGGNELCIESGFKVLLLGGYKDGYPSPKIDNLVHSGIIGATS